MNPEFRGQFENDEILPRINAPGNTLQLCNDSWETRWHPDPTYFLTVMSKYPYFEVRFQNCIHTSNGHRKKTNGMGGLDVEYLEIR